MLEDSSEYDVLILGGGFAGVYCAKSFASLNRKHAKLKIALVANENYMVFQPMLPEVVGASLSARHIANPLRSLCRDAFVYKAGVNSIDVENNTVLLQAGDFVKEIKLKYKHLALCLGASIDISRIPGMQEHALLLQNVGDAMRIRSDIISRFEEANLETDSDRKTRLLSIAIVGGGYSGVETAGQIIDLVHQIHGYYQNVDIKDCRVYIIHSRDHLLPTLTKKLGKYAGEKLQERGIKIIYNKRVRSMTANRVYLDDDEYIEANTVISTVGNAPHPVVGELCSKYNLKSEKGRIVTENNFSVPGIENLWSAGDCAAVPYVTGGYCPPTAQFAFRQGTLLGKNLFNKIANKKTREFKFKEMGELATIGHRKAVAEVFGLKFSGFIAWWMWRTIYLSKLPGLERKIRVVLEWTFELIFSRDVSLVHPRYSKVFNEVYLEKGDILFEVGDPAFSFYIIKSGCIELYDGDKLIKTLGDHQHFGEYALLGDKIRIYTAKAKCSTNLIVIDNHTFKQVVQSSGSFEQLLRNSAKSYISSEKIEKIIKKTPESVLSGEVSSLMTKDPIAFQRNMKLSDVLKELKRKTHSCYPVVSEDQIAEGIIYKEDFFAYLQTEDSNQDALVDTLPIHELPTVLQESSVREAMKLFLRNGVNKLLVVDHENRLRGMLTIIDVI